MMWQIWDQMQVCLIPKPDTLTTILSCFGPIPLHSGFGNKGCLFCQVRHETRFLSSSLLRLSSFLSTPTSLSGGTQTPHLQPSDLVALFWELSLHLSYVTETRSSVQLPNRARSQPAPGHRPGGPPAVPPLLLERGQQCQALHADTTPPRARRDCLFLVF